MRRRVQLVIETEASESRDVQEIMEIEREGLRPETMGLTLDEAKTVLERLQQQIVERQAAEYLRTQSHCPPCENKRSYQGRTHGHDPYVVRQAPPHEPAFLSLPVPASANSHLQSLGGAAAGAQHA